MSDQNPSRLALSDLELPRTPWERRARRGRRIAATAGDGASRTGAVQHSLAHDASYGERNTSAKWGRTSRLQALALAVMAGDGFVILVSSTVFELLLMHGGTATLAISPLPLLSAALLLQALHWCGAYSNRLGERLAAQLISLFVTASGILLLLLAVGYVTRTPQLYAHEALLGWYVTAVVGLGAVRALAGWRMYQWRAKGLLARTTAILDLSGEGRPLAHRIQRHSFADLKFLGLFSVEADDGKRVEDLHRLARESSLDDIIVAAADLSASKVSGIMEKVGAIPANLHVCINTAPNQFPRSEPAMLFGTQVLTVHRRPLGMWGSFVKRIEDLVLAIPLSVLLLPLIAVIGLLIKLDSRGPVLFRQVRLGMGNRSFSIAKFRTMYHDPGPEVDVPQAQRNDPRVTRVGRFLRRTSLDELPQLLNVLKGEMSLIGPRPHALPHNAQFSKAIEGYWYRHRIRPGITGLAQISGFRGETDTVEKLQSRIQYDLEYIERWSVLLDLKILAMTVVACFLGTKAY